MTNEADSMKTHVTIIGILFIALGVLALLVGCLALTGLIGGGLISGEQEAIIATSGVAIFVVCILALFSLPSIIGGIGLLKYHSWARILVLIMAVLNILNFPIGTVIGGYALWVLLNENTIKLFKTGGITSDYTFDADDFE